MIKKRTLNVSNMMTGCSTVNKIRKTLKIRQNLEQADADVVAVARAKAAEKREGK